MLIALRSGCRRTWAALDFQIENHVRLTPMHVTGKRMARREVHAVSSAVDRRLERFRKLDEQLDAVGRSRSAPGVDLRILRRHQQARHFLDRARFASRKRRHRESRNAQVLRERPLLHVVVDDQHHRRHRRRHREFVGSNGGLGEVAQRSGFIVPLDVVADHRRHVLGAVVRVDAVGPRAAPSIQLPTIM